MQAVGSRLSRLVSADLIREARLRAGFTQAELAERSGRERSVIARWEQGGSAPSLETLLDLLAVCGYDVPLELAERDDGAVASARESALLSPERRVLRMLQAKSQQLTKGAEGTPFDPYAILAALERHRVAYLVIGALARIIRGTNETAHELEITPSCQPPNLTRLQRSISELAAEHARTEPRSTDGTVTTQHGALTIVSIPPGSRRGYTDLRRAASRESIGRGLRPPVASAADLAGMLGARNRTEDRPTILTLRRLIRLGA
jgi:transcriptional regulator with XRE-family HTH domain